MNGTAAAEPPPDCALCPRLVAFRNENRARFPAFHNGPVDSFGDPAAELLVVGLAPGLKGANRTGRPFTGDYAGNLLYPTLIRHGFARGEFRADPDDGLELRRAMVTNAVRCVPPQNKPTGPETRTCRRFLLGRIAALPRLRVIFLLGRIAHQSVLAALGARQKDYPFAHAATHDLDGLVLVDSYHCSRYNVNTGRLTPEMFDAAFRRAKAAL
ncbi:MAG: uracil-DNA glycosylase [Alphaproteobacteria bacterium]|nr:MAG: uracil-DNA glycosylase [Alphaproteobacteria bacterium]